MARHAAGNMCQAACRALRATLMPLHCALQGVSEAEDGEDGHEAVKAEHAEEHAENKAGEAGQERLNSHSRAGPRQHPSGQTGNDDDSCNLHTNCPKDCRLHDCLMTDHILCGSVSL